MEVFDVNLGRLITVCQYKAVHSACLYLLLQTDGCYIEWRALADNDDCGDKDGWSVVNVDAVGFANNKNVELSEVEEVHTGAKAKGTCYISL